MQPFLPPLWRAAEPVNCILNEALQCLAVIGGAHSFPESCQIRGVRLTTEQTFRAGQSHLALRSERKKASLIPEVHKSKDLFLQGGILNGFQEYYCDQASPFRTPK